MPETQYHINPDREKPWNSLSALPIKEELYREIDILEKLGEAKAALARLHGRSVIIPNQGILINTISLQESKASSEIENIFTTDDELYKAYSDQHNSISATSKEVLKYREALWNGHEKLKNEDFSDDYFISTLQIVKDTTEEYRPDFILTSIKQGGTGPTAGKTIYTPPKGKKVIKQKMGNLIDFLNDDEKYKIDYLLKMVIGHFQFEAIHPFRDGNGRTGRIFNVNYLSKKGLLDFPILFLSKYILENKNEYYTRLSAVSQRGDWKNWFIFMLSAIENTSNITYQKINEIVDTKNNILQHIQTEAKNIRKPEEIVQAIFKQPFTKVKHLTDNKIYAENTARNYLNQLCEIEVLEKREIEGHFYYLNRELYRILSE